MKSFFCFVLVLSVATTFQTNAQTNCADKLASAKSITMSMVRGNAPANAQEALTTVLVKLSYDCPDEQKEYSKWVQNLDDPANKNIKGDVPAVGTYQTWEERQKNMNELNKETNRVFGGSTTGNGSNQYNNTNTNSDSNGNNNAGANSTLTNLLNL